jgi:hypothetical protein
LFGRDFEFVVHRRNWGEDRVYCRAEDGGLFSLPAGWTEWWARTRSLSSRRVADDAVTVDLNLRTYHPALIDAGFADLDLPIPWWNNRRLRFRFPPR